MFNPLKPSSLELVFVRLLSFPGWLKLEVVIARYSICLPVSPGQALQSSLLFGTAPGFPPG